MRLVAVPTTSGTGSEVSPAAVVTAGDRKVTLVDYSLVPDMAVVDPTLTLTMPPAADRRHGDRRAHPRARGLRLDLRVAVHGRVLPAGDPPDPRRAAARLRRRRRPRAPAPTWPTRATIAGLAFSNAFVGVNHALAHAVGARFGIAHGRANGDLPPPRPALQRGGAAQVHARARATRPTSRPEKYAQIAWVLGLGGRGEDAARERLFARVDELLAAVGMPALAAGARDPARGLDGRPARDSAAPRSPTRAGAPTRACRCSPSSRELLEAGYSR